MIIQRGGNNAIFKLQLFFKLYLHVFSFFSLFCMFILFHNEITFKIQVKINCSKDPFVAEMFNYFK